MSESAPRRVLVTGGSGFIGTHVLPLLRDGQDHILNVDVRAPVTDGERPGEWAKIDIRDHESLAEAVTGFDPTHVVHLAARTDTDSSELADYTSNTLGTTELLSVCRELPRLERFVFVSTQFVVRPGVDTRDALHFDPHTAYGESKVVGELLTRAALSPDRWVIVRPTNVWGPHHPRYGQEFLRVLASGRTRHRPDIRLRRERGTPAGRRHQAAPSGGRRSRVLPRRPADRAPPVDPGILARAQGQ